MLVTMKEILKDAKNRKYAVGAFNVPNLESIQAVISAAEELNVPVILQHAEVHENLISMQEIGPIMLDYARRASVPVCVHLDHGASFDLCIQAIRLGFTSIMYDASAKSYEENLEEMDFGGSGRRTGPVPGGLFRGHRLLRRHIRRLRGGGPHRHQAHDRAVHPGGDAGPSHRTGGL